MKLDRVRTSEEMADKLRGTYDVVSPSPDLAGRLVAEGKVAPSTPTLVQPYKDIPKRLRELPAMRQEDKVYGIPYLWGVNQVIYEGERPRGPEALYRPPPGGDQGHPAEHRRRRARAQKDQARAGDRGSVPAHPRSARRRRPKVLAEHDGPERVYWKDSLDVIRALLDGDVRLAEALPYHLDLFQRAGRPVKAPARSADDRLGRLVDAHRQAREPELRLQVAQLDELAGCAASGRRLDGARAGQRRRVTGAPSACARSIALGTPTGSRRSSLPIAPRRIAVAGAGNALTTSTGPNGGRTW